MQNSKLLETFILFTKDEINQLDKFLNSPYFISDKSRNETYPLFQYIISCLKRTDYSKLDKQQTYQHLFPKEKMIKGKIDKLMSALLKQIHQFIGIHFNIRTNNRTEHTTTLIRFYRQRNVYKLEQHHLNKINKEQDKIKQHNKQSFFNGYLIQMEEIERYLIIDKQFDTFDIDSALKQLDIYYLLNKLEYACFLLSLTRFRKQLNLNKITSFLDAAKPLYLSQSTLDTPLVSIYYHAYEMLKTTGDYMSKYKELTQMIQKNQKLIPFSSLKILAGLTRGFIAQQYNRGALHLETEIFSLHQSHLKKGYLNFENGLLPSTFKNLVTISIQTKNYDWALWFLNEYKDKIESTSNMQDVYNYNLAFYHFARKEYNKTLDLLPEQYEDLSYKLAAKILELKVYYEIQSEVLDARIDAFKVFIFRLSEDAILDHVHTKNNNFINFLRQIRKPKTRFSEQRVAKLISKIKDCQLLVEKEWLLEKVTELKK